MKHEFGGLWTRKKLAFLRKYLNFYTTALKRFPFKLHFVDAFAGTGRQDVKLISGQGDFLPEEDFEGSVRIALGAEPPFHEYHFNDLNVDHANALSEIAQNYPSRNISTYQKDANIFVPEFCSSMSKMDRAVLFLDPYNTELDWETLRFVAQTKKTDLWLLFPISVILRMTPKKGEAIKPEWKATIDRLLGTDDWEKALYKPVTVEPMGDLFSDLEPKESYERINVDELKIWITSRLAEVFPYVAKPVPLLNNGRPLFLFFFAVSNDSEKAKTLADRVVRHITKP